MDNLQKSIYGSVRPYTRHQTGCRYINNPDHNSCNCPKWLYVWNAETCDRSRKSLATPSWAEAQRIAAETLRGMDPEIAAARAVKNDRKDAVTVADACDLWIERTRNKFGEYASVLSQYQWLKKKVTGWANAHGIVNVRDITTLQLEQWYGSNEWNFAATTKQQRWGILRSMFSFLEKRGVIGKSPAAPIDAVRPEANHVQGPYTDAQVDRIIASIDKSVPFNLPLAKRPTYAPRIRTFINLLLQTGCDISDAVLHEPSRVEAHKVSGRKVYVYRYKRTKTDVEAVIPISGKSAADLESVPLEGGTSKDMPFRTQGLKLKLNQKVWSNRIGAVLNTAEVKWVDIPGRDKHGKPIRKAANAKQFRHTFAVRQLRDGQRPEDVAKMLGHVDTDMIRKHYAPWVKDLDLAHITRVVSMRKK
jgi:integrase